MSTSFWLALVLVLALLLILLVLTGVVLARVNATRRQVAELRTLADQHTEQLDHAVHLVEDDTDPDDESGHGLSKVAIIFNPSKHDEPNAVAERMRATVESIEGAQVTIIETTEDDPGLGQATKAMDDGAELVIAAGGDGTVRCVAAALAGSDVRMGIVPTGTGNLLARNLDIPLEDPEAAVLAALSGQDRRVDVGWLKFGIGREAAEAADEEIFLVMSGYGADAQMIGNTDPTLKKRMGWLAYVVGGAKSIVGRSHNVVVTLPGGSRYVVKARTVLIGNVGKLPGGLVLMPGATIDNGKLEVLVAGWRGAAGFGQIVTQIVNPRLVSKPKLSTMERYLTTSVRVATAKPQPVQLDGDTEDEATHLIARVDAGALRLRVPTRG
ncbi:diacylglycerol/lipid kinase family protein [Brachybacterium sillae]|uniref:diacylglycerol/lipid kinase family protein n=1 Tax=Brachybacterium sillae TaxID=2810536 RepID=UPI00217DF862|nr:diacylglycerol kinase family protein [Brachybacterium sillae]